MVIFFGALGGAAAKRNAAALSLAIAPLGLSL
jgi:hypothetical protein